MNINNARQCGVLVVACVVLLTGGCATLIAPQIVAPQGGNFHDTLDRNPSGRFMLDDLDAYISVRRRVAVGPPAATLAVAVVPPGHYALRFGTGKRPGCRVVYLTNSSQSQLMKASGHVWFAEWAAEHHMSEAQAKAEAKKIPGGIRLAVAAVPSRILRRYRASVASLRSTAAPKGTVILLPGDGNGMLSMLPWALLLGQVGYQSIVVDLRGEGRSTGKYVTYGALESRDLVQLVATLRDSGLIRGPLGLLGDSLGAATALLAAPHISHIAAVVAISPYARATTVIPRYARRFFWYAHLIPASSWRAAERKAGRIAGVSLAEAAPIEAVAKIRAPVLYLQGGRDRVVGMKGAHELAARTPDSDLLIYPKLDHLQMAIDYAQLAAPVLDWYNRHLAADRQPIPPPATGPRPNGALGFTFCAG